MQSLLFITPELPYPAQSGGKLKSLKLLKHLMSRYHVTLACTLKAEDTDHLEAFVEEFGSGLNGFEFTPLAVPRSAKNLMLSYTMNQPLNVFRTRSPALKQQIESLNEAFDIVFLDHYEVSQYVPSDHEGAIVYHAHNAYHQMWKRYADTLKNPLMKLAASLEASRIKRYEVSVCKNADLIFAAPADIDTLMIAGADGLKMQETFHLGDDSQLHLPALKFENTQLQLIYVGFLGWEPNVLGLLWFIEEVWPKLKEKYSTLTLDIVGKNADQRLISLVEETAGIQLVGFVEDLESVYPASRVCIAPLTFGSGMKVKVLNAMARGIPVATTSIGAESIDVKNGQHLMISNTADGMSEDINRLLEDSHLWNQLSTNSRKLIADKYTWQSLFEEMDLAMIKMGCHQTLELASAA